MWTEKLADNSCLYSFRCPMYVMYNTQEKTKLETKFRRFIFLEYTDGVNEYRQSHCQQDCHQHRYYLGRRSAVKERYR